MAIIHSSTRVAAGADIADDVEIGPNCSIGGDVVIARGCRLSANVVVGGRTSIGRGTTIGTFAALGMPPQSTSPYDPAGRLVVGADGRLGERVTVNVGTRAGGGLTQIGDRCVMLPNSHVGHDCLVGSDVVLGIGTALAGHCLVGDFARFESFSAAHQYSRIGASALVDIRTFVRADVIPFGVASGDISCLLGLNEAGMRQRRFAERDIHIAEEAYHSIFFGPAAFADRVDQAAARYAGHAVVVDIIDFIRTRRHRALCHPRLSWRKIPTGALVAAS